MNSEIKYCKYCNNELKKITYEIIDPDKTGEFERLYCKKCPRMFYFRDLTQRKTRKVTERKETKTKKSTKKQAKKAK